MQTTKLRTSLPGDYLTLYTWVSCDEGSFRMWAGPIMPYPPREDNYPQELFVEEKLPYSLVSSDGALLGFGQLQRKPDGHVHLIRIIVSPEHRGLGYGERLCRQLMTEAFTRWNTTKFSLNVLGANPRALKLYQRLKFERAVPPADSALEGDHIYMTLSRK